MGSYPLFSRVRLTALLLGIAGVATAQVDLTLPPQVGDAPARQARLEAPEFLESADGSASEDPRMEEVIVVRENPWRLPDLGSEWRAQHAAEVEKGRISATFLPLYDPSAERPMTMLFPVNRELTRAGFIEIFRVRFGSR